MTRVQRILAWGLFSLAMLVGSGLLLADHLTPPATGRPSIALPVQLDQTALDRELQPILDRHPGETGALMLVDGLDAFAARAMSARQAGRSLDLQYYIWHDDLTGRLLGREAWQAAERGVRVRVLLDDVNAAGKDIGLQALDAHENVEVRLYNPFRNRTGIGRLLEMMQRVFSLNHRMHNKAWIADNRVVILGGRNIGVEYFNASNESNFHDLDVMLFGPVVHDASTIFDEFWNSAAAVPLSVLDTADEDEIAELHERAGDEAESVEARRYMERVEGSRSVRDYLSQRLEPHWSAGFVVASDPPLKGLDEHAQGERLVDRIERELRGARRKLLLISPYFVPGERATNNFVALAGEGVYVGVITNSLAANDVPAVHGGYATYRPRLLAGGVRLYEIRAQAADDAAGDTGARGSGSGSGSGRGRGRSRGGIGSGSGSSASLHTKAFLVDDRHGYIGSFNMDPRSANLNTEMGLFFDHPALAAELHREYRHLASPALSYWVGLDAQGDLRWLDRATVPPRVSTSEPGASAWQRAQGAVMRWLPIESQL